MKLPCEQALWYLLPQIRSDLARELIKMGISQKGTANLLGLTPSAVSQYVHKKRAGKVRMSRDYKKNLKKVAEDIIRSKDEKEISRLICACCKEARSLDTSLRKK